MESDVAAGAMDGSWFWSASEATAPVVEEIVGPRMPMTSFSPARRLKALDASSTSPLSSMDLSTIFLPKMPPLALISLIASLNPLSSASPYAAAEPELVVTAPKVITSLSDSLMLLSLVAYMLPPEHAETPIPITAVRHSAANFLQ